MVFSSSPQGASPPRCNPAGCKPEKTGTFAKNRKPGSVGKSTLPGVEVAGFDTVRSMVARNPWSGFRSPFRANKLGAFPASPDSPPGWHFPRLPRPPRVLSPSFRIAITRDTHKGHPGLLCRSGGIRTRGLLVPNQTRYQTALHLVTGADEGTRTPDLLITNRLLYQLSHIGTTSDGYYIKASLVCPEQF